MTLAYGDGLINRKTLALSDTQTQVRLDGCSAVLANPTGFDYYVTNYSDTAWSALLPQLSRVTDPVLLTNLRNDAALLVSNQLAPASRTAALTSVSGPAAVSLRQMAGAPSMVRQIRPVVRYHGKFVARQRQVQ